MNYSAQEQQALEGLFAKLKASKQPKNKYQASVQCLGHVGETRTVNDRGIQLASYDCWLNALARIRHKPAYKEVNVAENFRCYAIFKTWYENLAKPFIEAGVTPELDKDWQSFLDGKPKSYDLERCILLPKAINVALRHLEKQLKQIDASEPEQLVSGLSLDSERKLIRVSIFTANKQQEHLAWFKLTELSKAKELLRKARQEDFVARCRPWYYLLKPSTVEQIEALASGSCDSASE